MLAQERRQFTAQFRAAVLSSPIGRGRLARYGGFPHASAFSAALSAGVVVASEKTLARLQSVADIIGFDGPALLDTPFLPLTPADRLVELVRRRVGRELTDWLTRELTVTPYPGGHVITLSG